MAKKPEPTPTPEPVARPWPADGSAPDAPPPYPGQERFGDWSLDELVPLNPGEEMVNDDPVGDPYKLAYQGEENPHLKKQKKP